MPRYAWRCRTCPAVVVCDSRCWPILDSTHELIHALEKRVGNVEDGRPLVGFHP